MNLAEASVNILNQLREVIEQLTEEDFKRQIPVLGNSTIGQHTRHTLEFFVCLKKSLDSGLINYDKRDHDAVIETDKVLTLTVIEDLISFLKTCSENISLQLESNYSLEDEGVTVVSSNLYRELVYNIEHAIHHMAIIKIGLTTTASYVEIPPQFGIAISTIKYRNKLST